MVLSQDLRLRIVDLGIVDLVASGVSRRKAAARFKVIASSAIRPVPPFARFRHSLCQTGQGSWPC